MAITPAAAVLARPLASRNRSPIYGADRLRELGQRLLQREGAFWRFYSRDEVQALTDT